MRPLVFFLALVGGIVATIAWILGQSRQIGGLELPSNYEDEGL